MGPNYARSRLWVDRPFQSRLLLRTALYILIYTYTVWHIGFLLEVLQNSSPDNLGKGIFVLYFEYVGQQKALLWALALITPLLMYDLLKFSHRIAGPLYRARKLLQEMANGKAVPAFTPRQHDLMGEFTEALNAHIKDWNARVGAANGVAFNLADTQAIATEVHSAPARVAVPEPQQG
jgi:hypothetical protein